MQNTVLKTLIAIGAFATFSTPAHASWLCHPDGSGCQEVMDGFCGAESTQNFINTWGLVCLGPVMEEVDDAVIISDFVTVLGAKDSVSNKKFLDQIFVDGAIALPKEQWVCADGKMSDSKQCYSKETAKPMMRDKTALRALELQKNKMAKPQLSPK